MCDIRIRESEEVTAVQILLSVISPFQNSHTIKKVSWAIKECSICRDRLCHVLIAWLNKKILLLVVVFPFSSPFLLIASFLPPLHVLWGGRNCCLMPPKTGIKWSLTLNFVVLLWHRMRVPASGEHSVQTRGRNMEGGEGEAKVKCELFKCVAWHHALVPFNL